MPTAYTTVDPLTGRDPNGPAGLDDRYDTDIGNDDAAGGNNADSIDQAGEDVDGGDPQAPDGNNLDDYGEDETAPERSHL